MASPSENASPGTLGLIIDQAIEAAVARAVAKALATHTCHTCEKSRPAITTTSTAATCTDSQRYPTIEKQLPTEVWEKILKYLYPSQLSRVSMVCRKLYDIVGMLPVWPEIYARVHPDDDNHLVGGIKPVVGKNPIKDFMLHVCAESFRICELCLSVHMGHDVPKDRMASLPLPVHVWRVRLAAKKDDTFQPLSAQIGPQDWVIRLCLGCRRKVFDACPESIPKTVQDFRDGSELMDLYHLSADEISSYRSSYLGYRERMILEMARLKYGSDIGIQAAAPYSSTRAVESMESRLQDLSLRLTRESVDG
ncbi:hypothetical protein BGX34_010750 [Mortierella sp. NVP85]|nr:hypothetical protein BGX34_010750 [Mortierella sp. NVP85]